MAKFLTHAAATMLLVAFCGGCSMCQQCNLDTYSAYGGRWQRTDRDHGRVGSVFAPAGFMVPYDAAAAPEAPPAEDSLGADAAGDSEAAPESGQAPQAEAGDSVLQPEADREEQERRLRELELEDIRYQK